MRRLVTLLACFAACLTVAACGGGSSTSTARPTSVVVNTSPPSSGGATSLPPTDTAVPSITRTPGLPCLATDLLGAYVNTDAAAGATFYQLGVTNISGVDCILTGRPGLRLENAAGADLGTLFAGSVACPTGGLVDPTTCVDDGAIDLKPGGPTPSDDGSAPGQVVVIVEVTDNNKLEPCASPHVFAHNIGLVYPDARGDVTIEMPDDIELQTCVSQVRLHGYGPAS